MLPALKRKNDVGISIPAESIERKPDEGAEYDVLESAADDLIAAVHSKDTKAVCVALRAAFELLESEPHQEAPIG